MESCRVGDLQGICRGLGRLLGVGRRVRVLNTYETVFHWPFWQPSWISPKVWLQMIFYSFYCLCCPNIHILRCITHGFWRHIKEIRKYYFWHPFWQPSWISLKIWSQIIFFWYNLISYPNKHTFWYITHGNLMKIDHIVKMSFSGGHLGKRAIWPSADQSMQWEQTDIVQVGVKQYKNSNFILMWGLGRLSGVGGWSRVLNTYENCVFQWPSWQPSWISPKVPLHFQRKTLT